LPLIDTQPLAQRVSDPGDELNAVVLVPGRRIVKTVLHSANGKSEPLVGRNRKRRLGVRGVGAGIVKGRVNRSGIRKHQLQRQDPSVGLAEERSNVHALVNSSERSKANLMCDLLVCRGVFLQEQPGSCKQ